MKRKTIASKSIPILMSALLVAGCAGEPAAAAQPPETSTGESAEAPVTEQEQPAPAPTEAPEPIPCNVAFDTDRDGNREIYIMGPDGENPTNLSNNPADDWDPAISPDGSQIAFVSNRDNEDGGGQFIYVMNADGSDVRQLTHEDFSSSPDWSHDGQLITYNTDDIYVIKADGSNDSIYLTDNGQVNRQPTWSSDGSHIAWLSGQEGAYNIFVMSANGNDVRQITDNGSANQVKWTVDGRLFTDNWCWQNQEEFCHNCVVDINGENIEDAGGKGEVQRYIPFWNGNGDRVEIIDTSLDNGSNEIYLVSDIFPDIFYNMTNDPADDSNPDWPANCSPDYVPSEQSGSIQEEPQMEEPQEEAVQPKNSEDILIGYEGDLSEIKLADLKQACSELGIQCVEGGSITELTDQGVDAIISFSSNWNVMGDWPEINAATSQGFPLYILDGETGEQGAYNLALESDWVHTSLQWMSDQMGDSGELVYLNFGSDLINEFIQSELEKHPDIQAAEIPVSYEDMSPISQESIAALVAEKPDLGAIWSSDAQASIFWGLNDLDVSGDHYPAIVCSAREEELQAWKDRSEAHPAFQCIATIKPAGNAYEAVYVAYYRLNGYELDPDALGGEFGNTLLYDDATITNDNLDEWLGKIDELRMNEWGGLEMPPMTSEEILDKWFLD